MPGGGCQGGMIGGHLVRLAGNRETRCALFAACAAASSIGPSAQASQSCRVSLCMVSRSGNAQSIASPLPVHDQIDANCKSWWKGVAHAVRAIPLRGPRRSQRRGPLLFRPRGSSAVQLRCLQYCNEAVDTLRDLMRKNEGSKSDAPSGRPRGSSAVQLRCLQYCNEAVDTLRDIMRKNDGSKSVALR